MKKFIIPLIALPVLAFAQTQSSPQWVSAQNPQGGSAFPAPPVQGQQGQGQQGQSAPTTAQPQVQNFPNTNYGPSNYATNGQPVNQVQQQGALAVAQNNPAPNGVAPLPPLKPPTSPLEKASQFVAPLKPSEIRGLRNQFEDTRRATAYQPIQAIPRISTLSVDLSPGSALPVLRVLPGEMSTIVFVDYTGAPWPLAAAPRVSNTTLFDVEWLEGTSSVVVSALSTFNDGNITVFLKGLTTPVVVKLATGEVDSPHNNVRVVDYRLDLRVPGRGPNAKPLVEGTPKLGLYNDTLQAFLDGVPPTEAKKVEVEGSPKMVQVWQIDNSLFVRTPFSIQTAFEQSLSAADGTSVYQIPLTPFVSLSENNRSVTYRLNIN